MENPEKMWAIRPTKLPREDPGIWARVDENSLNPENSFLFNNASVSGNDDSIPVVHDPESIHSRVSADSSTTSNNYLPSTAEPLSWHDARSVMRDVLNRYMDSSDSDDAYDYHGKRKEKQFQNKSNGNISKASMTAKNLYFSHITASLLFLFGSIVSVWLLHRRRFTSARGTEAKKRNTIASFLPLLDEMQSHSDGSTSNLTAGYEDLKEALPGTSLTDIYPVYRLSSAGNGKGRWHKVPSLLLVKGDFIALQLGDIAPAECKLIATGSKVGPSQLSSASRMSAPNLGAIGAGIGSHNAPKVLKEPLVIKGGDRVQIPPKRRFENRPNVQICDPLFLPGKSKVPENSKKLLHLTNRTKNPRKDPKLRESCKRSGRLSIVLVFVR
eukprot:scaffold2170_cov265-Chaetoceros_neogracile.AAC.1